MLCFVMSCSELLRSARLSNEFTTSGAVNSNETLTPRGCPCACAGRAWSTTMPRHKRHSATRRIRAVFIASGIDLLLLRKILIGFESTHSDLSARVRGAAFTKELHAHVITGVKVKTAGGECPRMLKVAHDIATNVLWQAVMPPLEHGIRNKDILICPEPNGASVKRNVVTDLASQLNRNTKAVSPVSDQLWCGFQQKNPSHERCRYTKVPSLMWSDVYPQIRVPADFYI